MRMKGTVKMSDPVIGDYYSNKMALLKQCLMISEDFISSLENWESLNDILAKKNEVITEIELLEQSYGKDIMDKCSQEQREEIDQLIKLILNLDQEAVKLIQKGQDTVLSSIKTNVQEQKLIQYGSNLIPQKGRHIDYKK
ncbi:MAG TPA: hypothetical protein VM577_15765 [Anaerovoracaceae bacterium]|nr:hypothetical protein [Anaerovoracaceae bacterium]